MSCHGNSPASCSEAQHCGQLSLHQSDKLSAGLCGFILIVRGQEAVTHQSFVFVGILSWLNPPLHCTTCTNRTGHSWHLRYLLVNTLKLLMRGYIKAEYFYHLRASFRSLNQKLWTTLLLLLLCSHQTSPQLHPQPEGWWFGSVDRRLLHLWILFQSLVCSSIWNKILWSESGAALRSMSPLFEKKIVGNFHQCCSLTSLNPDWKTHIPVIITRICLQLFNMERELSGVLSHRASGLTLLDGNFHFLQLLPSITFSPRNA